jgi:hypothetical protein
MQIPTLALKKQPKHRWDSCGERDRVELPLGELMPEKVNIPISRFEYRADYVQPNIMVLLERVTLVKAMFEAMLKWHIAVDGLEPISTGKTSEQGLKIKLPGKKITMFFGASYCTFIKEDADWSTAQEVIEILHTFLETLSQGGVQIGSQKTTVSLHIQPTTKTFLDILKPFLSTQIQALADTKLLTGASLVKWETGRVTLDGSGLLANAVFLLFEQNFEQAKTLENIATEIRSMEEKLLRMLDIEEAV